MSSKRTEKKTHPTKTVRQTAEAVCRPFCTSCRESGGTKLMKAVSLLKSIGIELVLGREENGLIFTFFLPVDWSLYDRREFNEAVAGNASSDAEPCNICGSVLYSDAAIVTCTDCGEEFVMCEECLMTDVYRGD